jgi:ABC-2 type transport system ATP-binding protein
MDEENAIVVDQLAKYYGSYPAVNHISFKVKRGTVFGLLGPNGAGKSTTIKMLTTLLPPTSGHAHLLGHDIITDSQGVRTLIGYVPQLISADGELTAYENLRYSGQLYDLPKQKREERICEVLDFMGLTIFKNQLVSGYSGGMIRRLEIAQALLHEPQLIFLDEPTSGLDPGAKVALWKYIVEWKNQNNTTVFLCTHDMDEADKLCDLIAVLYMGKIVAMDTPSELKRALGPHATLNDVFIHHTGASLNDKGNYDQVKQQRRNISHLD